MSDLIERLNEPEICDGCKGSGQTATGYTGGESDGNAPELETCGTCGGPGSYVSDLHRDAAAELSRLTAEVERLRADAGRYATIDLLHANGDVRISFDEDGRRVGVHLEEAAECADGSWLGDDLDAAVDAATRQITETDEAIKEAGNG